MQLYEHYQKLVILQICGHECKNVFIHAHIYIFCVYHRSRNSQLCSSVALVSQFQWHFFDYLRSYEKNDDYFVNVHRGVIEMVFLEKYTSLKSFWVKGSIILRLFINVEGSFIQKKLKNKKKDYWRRKYSFFFLVG